MKLVLSAFPNAHIFAFSLFSSASTTKQAKYAIQCLNSIIQDDEEKRKMFAQILDSVKVCRQNHNCSSDQPSFL